MKKKWFLIAIILVALVVFLSYPWDSASSSEPTPTPVVIESPGEVAVKYFTLASTEHNYTEAEKLISGELKRRFDSDGGLAKMNEDAFKNDPALTKSKFTISLNEEKIISEYAATVKILITERIDGSEKTAKNITEVRMIFLKDRWLLDGFIGRVYLQ